jgi:cadmium resistance protein CadD (predicted permease)
VATFAGLLYLGTGASTFCQMIWCLSFTGYVPESTVTLIFAIIPLLLGTWILLPGRPDLPDTRRRRISLAVAGVLGFVAWAGLLAGPALAIVAAVLPEKGPAGKGTG